MSYIEQGSIAKKEQFIGLYQKLNKVRKKFSLDEVTFTIDSPMDSYDLYKFHNTMSSTQSNCKPLNGFTNPGYVQQTIIKAETFNNDYDLLQQWEVANANYAVDHSTNKSSDNTYYNGSDDGSLQCPVFWSSENCQYDGSCSDECSADYGSECSPHKPFDGIQ